MKRGRQLRANSSGPENFIAVQAIAHHLLRTLFNAFYLYYVHIPEVQGPNGPQLLSGGPSCLLDFVLRSDRVTHSILLQIVRNSIKNHPEIQITEKSKKPFFGSSFFLNFVLRILSFSEKKTQIVIFLSASLFIHNFLLLLFSLTH